LSSEWLQSAFLEHPPRRVASLTASAPPPRPVPAVSSRSENAPSSRKPTTTVKIKKKAGAKKPDADGFYDAETPEEFAKRKAETEARVAGIEALLKEQSAKLEATQQKAEESVKQLAQVMSEKNTVERMLEEMERKKEQIEAEKEAMRDANNELLDTVTVLKDARAADHVKHAITVRKWRNELVAYQEKTPTEFLAEILHLVSDMDNEVEIEIADAELAASRRGGGVRVAKAEELAIDDEWSHNPRLAMAEPDRLCRLASRTRAPLALGDGPAQVLAANESVDRGASGVEIKMTTPTQAAKRRAALGNISVNAAKSPAVKASAALKSPAARAAAPVPAVDARKQALLAEMAAARVEMEALKHETAAVGLLDVPASPSDAKRFGTGSRAKQVRGFGAEKASLNLSFFGGRVSKKSPTAVRQSRAAAAVAGVARRQQMAAAVFDDFGSENVAPAGRAGALSPR
jgi:hypothetical protein